MRRIKIPLIVRCWFANLQVMALSLLAMAFLFQPNFVYASPSYTTHRLVPQVIWGVLYLSTSAIGVWAIYRHNLTAWRIYSLVAVSIFVFNVTAFTISVLTSGGISSTIAVHFCFAYGAFRDYSRPFYWLFVSEGAAKTGASNN